MGVAVNNRPTLTELADDLRNSAEVLRTEPDVIYAAHRIADNLTNTANILDDLATAQVGDDGSWQATVTVREMEPPSPDGTRWFKVGELFGQRPSSFLDRLGIPVPPPATTTITVDGHTLTIPAADADALIAKYGEHHA
jgi:hypothetical protein